MKGPSGDESKIQSLLPLTKENQEERAKDCYEGSHSSGDRERVGELGADPHFSGQVACCCPVSMQVGVGPCSGFTPARKGASCRHLRARVLELEARECN